MSEIFRGDLDLKVALKELRNPNVVRAVAFIEGHSNDEMHL